MKKLFFDKVIDTLLTGGYYRATMYVSPKYVIKATRVRYDGKFLPKYSNTEIVVTIGRPNAREIKFVKDCIKAGEPFPVKRVQVQNLPVRRKK